MGDDRWRDTYDDWKLRSPYDDEPEVECDHAEYDVDWEGRATCDYCRARWWLIADELKAHDEAQARWMDEYYRMERREHNPFWRTVSFFREFVSRLRLHKPSPVNDDLPF